MVLEQDESGASSVSRGELGEIALTFANSHDMGFFERLLGACVAKVSDPSLRKTNCDTPDFVYRPGSSGYVSANEENS